MPKRRVTSKQKAASRRNLVKARAARKGRRPQGKSMLLVHFGSAEHINRVLKRQAFRPHPDQANVGHVFGTPWWNRRDPQFRGRYGYGHSGVTFTASRRAVVRDTDWPHPRSRMVPASAIHGRIKRLGRR